MSSELDGATVRDLVDAIMAKVPEAVMMIVIPEDGDKCDLILRRKGNLMCQRGLSGHLFSDVKAEIRERMRMTEETQEGG